MTKLNNFLADIQTQASRGNDKELAMNVRTLTLITQELMETVEDYHATKNLMVSIKTAKPVKNKPGWFLSSGPMGFENGATAKESVNKVEKMIPQVVLD